MLPPRSAQLIEATPIERMKTGFKACIELTVYPDGHSGIAVSAIEGSPPSRRIVQRDSLPLNDVPELREHVLAVIDHLADGAGLPSPQSREVPTGSERHWTISELEHELRRFEHELKSAQLRRSSIDTYIGRSTFFLRWLQGDYVPRGPTGSK